MHATELQVPTPHLFCRSVQTSTQKLTKAIESKLLVARYVSLLRMMYCCMPLMEPFHTVSFSEHIGVDPDSGIGFG